MRFAKCLPLLLGLAVATPSLAQNYVISNDISVMVNGNPLKSAWAGGLNAPQFSSVDLDNDGTLDLVIFDRVGPRLLTFINEGTAGQTDFHFAPAYADLFPQGLVDWVLMRDFDADGKMDLWTAVPQVSNVKVYRNTSAQTGGTLSFALHEDTIYTNYPPVLPLYMGKSDIPAIDDIDGDGDLDMLTFHIGGQEIEWHKNLSVENTGGLLGMEFQVQSRCFGHFEEDPFTCTALLNRVPCGTGQRYDGTIDQTTQPSLHAGSSTLSLDLNADGLRDLLVGDVGCPTIYSLVNGGTTQIAHFSSSDPHYPSPDSSVTVTIFPASYYLDMDNDGLKDLVVAPNATSQIEDERGVMFHKNTGQNNQPDFVFQRYGLMQGDMIDMGTGSNPTFLDYNDDGLMDILVGGDGRFDSLNGYIPRLQLFGNVGTAQQPVFDLVAGDYLGLGSNATFTGISWIKPTAGDLDHDGDWDLLLGASDGTLYYFQNVAAPNSAAVFVLTATNYAGIDVGLNSTPQLVDLDADNDLDLLIGNHRGYVQYWDNIGSPTVPNFALVDDTLGQVKLNDYTGLTVSNGFSQPLALDYDGDSDLDLLVGGITGDVAVFENISLVPGASFVQSGTLFGRDFGLNASPAAAVLDSSRLTYVVGDLRGGLTLMRDAGPLSSENPQPQAMAEIWMWPQPASTVVNFRWQAGEGKRLDRAEIYDMLGQLERSIEVHGSSGQLDVQGLAAGMYRVVFSGKGLQASKPLVIARD
ncbi:MAG: FG-GAP-like repeat-containing protein [Bacteroidia bacterium]